VVGSQEVRLDLQAKPASTGGHLGSGALRKSETHTIRVARFFLAQHTKMGNIIIY
jgi:hypothetical protein